MTAEAQHDSGHGDLLCSEVRYRTLHLRARIQVPHIAVSLVVSCVDAKDNGARNSYGPGGGRAARERDLLSAMTDAVPTPTPSSISCCPDLPLSMVELVEPVP